LGKGIGPKGIGKKEEDSSGILGYAAENTTSYSFTCIYIYIYICYEEFVLGLRQLRCIRFILLLVISWLGRVG
jgi:hypothetical protein